MIEFQTTQNAGVWINPLHATSVEGIAGGSVVTMGNGSKFYLVLAPAVVVARLAPFTRGGESTRTEQARAG